ncbi:hypothetical protein ABGB14_01085 [Nonomuraea sp. B10E15]|uniref:hypothetical protein n=1 Tax=Nonomuraea sp. B10E15 TaxID=3153560 RepID=UPI00325D2BC0
MVGLVWLDPQSAREVPELTRRARDRPRAGIESTAGRIIHRTGIRRSSHKSIRATHIGHCLAATAINLIRLDAWRQDH